MLNSEIVTRFPTGARNVFSPKPPIRLWLNKHPIHWVLTVLSLGIKWPGREADHSPSSSAEVKNEWSYTSIPHSASWQEQQQLYFYLTHAFLEETYKLTVSIVQTNSAFLLFHNRNSIGLQYGTRIRLGRILNYITFYLEHYCLLKNKITSDKNKVFKELTTNTSLFQFYRCCFTKTLVNICLQSNNKVKFS